MVATLTAPDVTDTTDPQVMRTRVLVALADAVLTEHARRLAVLHEAMAGDEFASEYDRPLEVSPAAALVDVTQEVSAYWSLQQRDAGGTTVEEYREIATDAWHVGIELLAGSVGSAISAARRATGLSYW